MQLRRGAQVNRTPPVKSYDQISFLPDFTILITIGGWMGPVLREGDLFGKNALSVSISIGPKTKNKLCAMWISKKVFFKHPSWEITFRNRGYDFTNVQSLSGPNYVLSLKRRWLHMAARGTWSVTTVPYVANWPLLQRKGKHMNANTLTQIRTSKYIHTNKNMHILKHNDKHTNTNTQHSNARPTYCPVPEAILSAVHNYIMPIPAIVILSNVDHFSSPNCFAWH